MMNTPKLWVSVYLDVFYNALEFCITRNHGTAKGHERYTLCARQRLGFNAGGIGDLHWGIQLRDWHHIK